MLLIYMVLCFCLTVNAGDPEGKKKFKCNKRTNCKMIAQLKGELETVVEMVKKQQKQIEDIEQELDDKDKEDKFVKECSDLTLSERKDGVFIIYPYLPVQTPVNVYCDVEPNGNAWTVIQRRMDGSVDFYRGWNDYKNGFGSADGEYWIGNDVLHELTSSSAHELRVEMSTFDGQSAFARYSTFRVDDETNGYRLTVGGYSGTAGDSFSYQNGHKFTTKDKDQDNFGTNCAQKFGGAWWYHSCHMSNLNGKYLKGPHSSFADGVNWKTYKGYNYSLKTSTMMIRKT